MKIALILLCGLIVACTTMTTKERQPSSVPSKLPTTERVPLLVSENMSRALTRSVTDKKQLRFQTCSIRVNYLASNQAVLEAVNKADASCQDINATSFEVANQPAAEMLDKTYSDTLRNLLVQESKNAKLYDKVAVAAFAGGISAMALSAVLITKAGQMGYRARLLGDVGLAVGAAGMLSTLAYGITSNLNFHNYMAGPPATLEKTIDKMIQEQKLTSADAVGASYLYEEIQKAVDQATKLVFDYFYSA